MALKYEKQVDADLFTKTAPVQSITNIVLLLD